MENSSSNQTITIREIINAKNVTDRLLDNDQNNIEMSLITSHEIMEELQKIMNRRPINISQKDYAEILKKIINEIID